jgi:hypothetical protein
MLFTSSITLPMLFGSIPRISTPAVLDWLEAMASPVTTGVAACTPGTSRILPSKSSHASVPSPVASGAGLPAGPSDGSGSALELRLSMLMCALLPRIFCLRSAPKPPMIETTAHKAKELIATPAMDKIEMTVKNPLLEARTCRAATKLTKLWRSRRSSSQGRASDITDNIEMVPNSAAPTLTIW